MAKAALKKVSKKKATAPNLNHPTYYINRELSWIEFNARVLEEALDPEAPLLERVKFLSIFSSNLDEFFMIRVSGLKRQLEGGALQAPPDGMTPAAQLAAIRDRLLPLLEKRADCWDKDLRPQLREAGVRVFDYDELSRAQRKALRQYFERELFPILTPLAFDPAHPFPHISNLSINLAVLINDPESGERFARVKVPHMLPRLVRVPAPAQDDDKTRLGLAERSSNFVWLEEVVRANLDMLFPGVDIKAAFAFRVTRNADVEIEEDEASDLLAEMEEVVGQRHFGFAIRLEVDPRMPTTFRELLISNLDLAPFQVYSLQGHMGLADVLELTKVDRPDLKDHPFRPLVPPFLATEESVFSVLRRRNILLYHPYDSFNPLVDFVSKAANDPQVLAIKQTLYRVGPNSPIVRALKEARQNGKQVSVLVELKARFDEADNIVWAKELERAGVHVVYGLLGLKTHAKMCLVVRRELSGLVRYVHIGTGNYNPVTARIYTDLGFLTTDPVIAADVSHLFNALTGYSRKEDYNKLLVAPSSMRKGILQKIKREIKSHRETGGGRIILKVNSIVDKACIRALYKASQAGVKVDLLVRGICCLRPQVPRVSENITVTSIVGRFLEHTRILYFRNGGDEEILIGSADLMPRNLDGRVEIMVPIDDPALMKTLRDEILMVHLKDNAQARVLQADGHYRRLRPGQGQPIIDSQMICLENAGAWHPEE